MQSGLFEPETTPEQQAALARLETLLALIEGWVDAVVADAVGERLPGAGGAARDAAPAPGVRRAGRADLRHRGRAGAAAAPAAGGRRAVAAAGRAARDRRARRAVGAPRPDPHGRRPRRPGRVRRPRARWATRSPSWRSWPARGAGGPRGGDHGRPGEDEPTIRRHEPTAAADADRLAAGSAAGVGSASGLVAVDADQARARRRRTALQVAHRPLGARVAVHPRPEPRVVAGFEQVGQLVHEHVVDHPAGRVAQPLADPDGAVDRGAGRPAGAHRRHPAHRGRARPDRRGSGGTAPRCAGAARRRPCGRASGGGPRCAPAGAPSRRPSGVSSDSLIQPGMNTITVSPSRRALTMRRRRSLRRTSTTAGCAIAPAYARRPADRVRRRRPSCPQPARACGQPDAPGRTTGTLRP